MTGVGGDELLGSVVSAAAVAHRIATLQDRFGSFPVRTRTRENDPAYFAEGCERALAGWRGDAGALVTDVDGRVLLIRHADAPETWGTPGGGHEPGESFTETARREVREETGVDPALTGVHEAIRTEITHEDDPDRRFTMLTVHFDGVVNAAEPELDGSDDEIRDARWFETPPESLHEHCEDWVRETLADFEPTDERVARTNQRYVDARIAHLDAAFDGIQTRTDRIVSDDDAFADYVEAVRDPERIGGAYAFVVRPGEDAPAVSPSMPAGPEAPEYHDSRALLVRGRGEDAWTVPGGGAECSEPLAAAAEREVREETGVDCEVSGVHEVVRGIGERERDGLEVHFLHVVFDARYLDGSIDIQESELNGAAWFRTPPDSDHWRVESGLSDWFESLADADTD